MTPKVFLCHCSQDKPIVRRLGELLRLNDVDTWIDECDLDTGSRWQKGLLEGMIGAPAVIVCLGPHGLGRWQEHEIDIVAQKRIEGGKNVIPLILPTCGITNPDVPLWLSSAQVIDLRRDEIEVDPFGRLLKGIDSREPVGHYRPSVLVLWNSAETTSTEALAHIQSECGNVLHRVRVMDYSQPLLAARLTEALKHINVLVSLLAPDSYDRGPGEAFYDGIAHGAKRLAEGAGAKVVQWRSETMVLPTAQNLAKQFRSLETETLLTTKLAAHVSANAEAHYTQTRIRREAQSTTVGKRRVVLGYPLNRKRFVRQVTEELKEKVDCNSPPKWDLVLNLLQNSPPLFEALVVVLTGDDDWLCDCTVALRRLQDLPAPRLPQVRAFLHKADDPLDADPIPIRLDAFDEYYGLPDLPRLVQKIVSAGGVAS